MLDVGAPPRSRGRPAFGRVARLSVGQSYGFIRLEDGRDVFFHRADLRDGTSFNELAVGDCVKLEVLEDRISGARALDVRRRSR